MRSASAGCSCAGGMKKRPQPDFTGALPRFQSTSTLRFTYPRSWASSAAAECSSFLSEESQHCFPQQQHVPLQLLLEQQPAVSPLPALAQDLASFPEHAGFSEDVVLCCGVAALWVGVCAHDIVVRARINAIILYRMILISINYGWISRAELVPG